MSEYDIYPKAKRIEKELMREIAEGRHGSAGTPFMTTRALMEYKAISLKTAHRILGSLCSADLLEVQGKRYYLKKREMKEGIMRIGLLLTRLNTPYFSNLAANIEELTREMGAELSIAVSDYDETLEQKKIEMFLEDGVSGIIATPWGIRTNAKLYESLPVPLVLIGRKLKHADADTVLLDNRRAAFLAAEHLSGPGGCTDFAYWAPENLQDDERCAGFRLGLLSKGITLREDHIFRSESEERVPHEFIELLRQTRKLPSERRLGVFCYHDLFAAKVINLCHEEMLAVPEKVSVVGFDNLPVAAAIYPALTTIACPVRDIARAACEILFTRIHCSRMNGAAVRYIDTRLIQRGSTKGGEN